MIKISNSLLRSIDKSLFEHLKSIDYLSDLNHSKWLRTLFSREFTLSATLTLWDYFFSDIDYSLLRASSETGPAKFPKQIEKDAGDWRLKYGYFQQQVQPPQLAKLPCHQVVEEVGEDEEYY